MEPAFPAIEVTYDYTYPTFDVPGVGKPTDVFTNPYNKVVTLEEIGTLSDYIVVGGIRWVPVKLQVTGRATCNLNGVPVLVPLGGPWSEIDYALPTVPNISYG